MRKFDTDDGEVLMYVCTKCNSCYTLKEKNWILDGPKWNWGTYMPRMTQNGQNWTWIANGENVWEQGEYCQYAFCSMECYRKMKDPDLEMLCQDKGCFEVADFGDFRCKAHTWITDEEIDLTQ